jgi:hypothetical protein
VRSLRSKHNGHVILEPAGWESRRIDELLDRILDGSGKRCSGKPAPVHVFEKTIARQRASPSLIALWGTRDFV